MENKKSILILILLLVFSLLFISLFTKKKVDKTVKIIKDPIAENLPQGVSLIKPKSAESLPQGFPEVPLNGKKFITNAYALSYEGQPQDQKVVDFVSSKSVKENFDFYKDWAEKNKWDILYELNNADKAIIVIRQDKNPININIVKDIADHAISKINMNF